MIYKFILESSEIVEPPSALLQTDIDNIIILKVEHLSIVDKNKVLLFRNRFDGFQKFNFIKHPEQ